MAITREIIAVNTPRKNELRTAKVSHQKMSWPRELVPKRCSHDGGLSIATTKVLFGSSGEMKDRKIITTTAARKTKAILKRPSYFSRSRKTLSIVSSPIDTVPVDRTAGRLNP